MSKNVQTTAQLHSFRMLVRSGSKSCMLGFSIMWTKNLQMSMLDLEKAEKSEINQKNIYLCFIDYAKAFDCVDHTKLWKTLKETGIPDHLNWFLRNLYTGQEATVRTLYGITDWFRTEKGEWQGCLLSPCLFNLYVHHETCRAGWVISWNQDFQEKYQEPQKCRWYRSKGRRRRGTKEPLDEDKGGEWNDLL